MFGQQRGSGWFVVFLVVCDFWVDKDEENDALLMVDAAVNG